MTEFLVVRLPAADSQLMTWVITDDAGDAQAMPETGFLDDLARKAVSRKVIALLPSATVLRTRVNLPIRGQARILQALPFALEEQLAADVASLHFAVGQRDTDGRTDAAVTDRESLQLRLDQLRQVGAEPIKVFSECDALPVHQGFTILIDNGQVLARNPGGECLAGAEEDLDVLLDVLGASSEQQYPDSHVYADSGFIENSHATGKLRLVLPEIELHRLTRGSVAALASNAVRSQGVNLLQGPFAIAGEGSRYWKAWRRPAMLAAALLITILAGKAIEVIMLKSRLSSLTAQLDSIAVEALPANSRIVDAVAQLEQHAARLRGGPADSDNTFVEMLRVLATSLQGLETTTIGKMDYRNGTLDLTVTAPDLDTLDRIRTGVERGGLAAEIKSSSTIDLGVEGRLRIGGA